MRQEDINRLKKMERHLKPRTFEKERKIHEAEKQAKRLKKKYERRRELKEHPIKYIKKRVVPFHEKYAHNIKPSTSRAARKEGRMKAIRNPYQFRW